MTVVLAFYADGETVHCQNQLMIDWMVDVLKKSTVGRVGAIKANPGLPEGRYSNPSDNQNRPLCCSMCPYGKGRANISKQKPHYHLILFYYAGAMVTECITCGTRRAANLCLIEKASSRGNPNSAGGAIITTCLHCIYEP